MPHDTDDPEIRPGVPMPRWAWWTLVAVCLVVWAANVIQWVAR